MHPVMAPMTSIITAVNTTMHFIDIVFSLSVILTVYPPFFPDQMIPVYYNDSVLIIPFTLLGVKGNSVLGFGVFVVWVSGHEWCAFAVGQWGQVGGQGGRLVLCLLFQFMLLLPANRSHLSLTCA